MPDYVYALHDFLPEHEDEVSFRAGERIEVVEKDDLYGDGWWQGRNLAGRVGLFPQSYTAPAPPSTDTLLLAAPSTSATPDDDALPDHDVANNNNDRTPIQLPEFDAESLIDRNAIRSTSPINGEHATHERVNSTGDGEVMKATMTDVQKAIEQLGRRATTEDGDGGRSFSFASTREGPDDTEGETDDTDFDMSDMDGADSGAGEGWHKGARRKLAAKARRAIEEAEKLEAMMGNGDRRAVAPPIEVELSDESEGEDDHDGEFTTRSTYPREHPHIPEEDEDVETDGGAPPGHLKHLSSGGTTTAFTEDPPSSDTIRKSPDDSTHMALPERDIDDPQTATATQPSFPVFHAPPSPSAPSPPPPAVDTSEERERDVSQARLSLPTPVFPVPASSEITTSATAPEQKLYRESMVALPSPTISSAGTPPPIASQSKHSSIASALSNRALTSSPSALTQPPLTASSLGPTLVEEKREKEKTPPSEWSVEEVIEWLKSKGFDQDVCDKFVEQEITGDVLLELDVNLLKTEIGIMAFGKRVRIANAITDLRRPPSIVYSDHLEGSPSSPMMMMLAANNNGIGHTNGHGHGTNTNGAPSPLFPQSQTHSRNQSQSQSQHSYMGPGTAPGHAYSQSVQSSVGSPLVYGGGYGNGYGNGNGNGVQYAAGDAPVSPVTRDTEGSEMSTAGEEGAGNGSVGLGIGLPTAGAGANVIGTKSMKARPAHLMLSPSDGQLHASAKAVSDIPEEAEEERGHMSEGEIVPTTTSMRRRLFDRSHDSSAASGRDSRAGSRHSKEGLSPTSVSASPTMRDVPEKEKGGEKERDSASTGSRHARGKKSLDSGKGGDRLSIFGGTFGGTLGKSRKPAPRYSGGSEEAPAEKEKGSMFSLPRIHSGVVRKASSSTSHRPSTPGGSPKDFKEKIREPTAAVKEKDIKDKSLARDPTLLRKRTSSAPSPSGMSEAAKPANGLASPLKAGQSILEQIGEADHNGWMRKKGDRYNNWKMRYFVLKGPHLYCLRSNSKSETKIKGYINIIGYKVTVDENVDPGRYGFRIHHEHDKTHWFSSDEKMIIRDWMKAIMKATIGRDYTKPVVSSCNIPTIPLMVAQAMNPAPRPPSPTARDATQKALRRENPNQLSSRDARVLMGLPGSDKEDRARLDSFFANEPVGGSEEGSLAHTPKGQRTSAPPRPSREMRRLSSQRSAIFPVDDGLIEWANSHLPSSLQITDPTGPLCGGLALLRLAESIKGRPSTPPVPDSAFPTDAGDDKLDGLFRLFDFLLDNDVKMGSVSINDVRQGKRDKIVQLLRALKAWEDKRKAIVQSIGKGSVQVGGFMAPVGMTWAGL